MILAFYVLYALLTPVNFSWIWFLIAVLMQFLQFSAIREQERRKITKHNNYWKGDE